MREVHHEESRTGRDVYVFELQGKEDSQTGEHEFLVSACGHAYYHVPEMFAVARVPAEYRESGLVVAIGAAKAAASL